MALSAQPTWLYLPQQGTALASIPERHLECCRFLAGTHRNIDKTTEKCQGSQLHLTDCLEDTLEIFSTALPFPACGDSVAGGLAVVKQLDSSPVEQSSSASEPFSKNPSSGTIDLPGFQYQQKSASNPSLHLVLVCGFCHRSGKEVVKVLHVPVPKAPDPLAIPLALNRSSRPSSIQSHNPSIGDVSNAGSVDILSHLHDMHREEKLFCSLVDVLTTQDRRTSSPQILTLDKEGPSLFNVEPSSTTFQTTQIWQGTSKNRANKAAAVSPHNASEFVTVGSDSIELWDARTGINATIKAVGNWDVYRAQLDVDYNPNKEFELVSSGEDGSLRFWDSRRLTDPIFIFRKAHDLWCNFVQYNQYHDQLILTAGCENLVNLWKFYDSNDISKMTDKKTKQSETPVTETQSPALIHSSWVHEDAISALCWNENDPWTFASCGSDRRISLHQVPSPEKYELLL